MNGKSIYLRWLFIIIVGIVLLFLFAVGTTSYFHTKEINYMVEGCYEIGGSPVLEASHLNLDYSFQCSKADA